MQVLGSGQRERSNCCRGPGSGIHGVAYTWAIIGVKAFSKGWCWSVSYFWFRVFFFLFAEVSISKTPWSLICWACGSLHSGIMTYLVLWYVAGWKIHHLRTVDDSCGPLNTLEVLILQPCLGMLHGLPQAKPSHNSNNFVAPGGRVSC